MAKKNNIEFHKPEGNGNKPFYDDKPYAHMYMKDKEGYLVRMVETQPLVYLFALVENIDQSTRTVQMLNNLNERQLETANIAMAIGDAESLEKVQIAIGTILSLKKDISDLTKSAPSDIDNLKTLMTRLLQDSQAEDAMLLTGGREKAFRENAIDVLKSNQPEIIKMED